MNRQAPPTPDSRGVTDDRKDPTQRMPEATGPGTDSGAGADDEARRILQQQHTGNHQKPAGESADAHGGTRHGAENVEPGRAAPGDRETG